MDEIEQIGQLAIDKVRTYVADPRRCRQVDSATQSLVKSVLRNAGGDGHARSVAGRAVGGEVRKLCEAITPEGRSVLVLTGAAAAVVYGVLNWDEVEPQIRESIRGAQVPVKIPLDKFGHEGKLTLSLGLERLGTDYSYDLKQHGVDGRFSAFARHNLATEQTSVGFRIEFRF